MSVFCDEDFDTRDVMVGVMRNSRQLEYNVKCGFYHIPEEWVPENRLPIRYVALYQSERLFHRENTGVFLYGRVRETRLVPRKCIDIPTVQEAEKLYYKFYVESWEALPKPIALSNAAPPVNIFTSVYQLMHADNVSQLMAEDAAQWRAYRAFHRISGDTCILMRYDRACGICCGDLNILWKKGVSAKVYCAGKRICKMKYADFCALDFDVLAKELLQKRKGGK